MYLGMLLLANVAAVQCLLAHSARMFKDHWPRAAATFVVAASDKEFMRDHPTTSADKAYSGSSVPQLQQALPIIAPCTTQLYACSRKSCHQIQQSFISHERPR